ncbi:sugar phosphate nucleotidyltransferase [Xanthobacteraceae bacterium Astr-EGSB]|uniref:sugar phosphate nucleotidyltransferase n=1 Tax=Astrobacterium formosum TaxID=3069710 RepID=UPI0027AFA745|nr:sugar phosphate nucleotidyltransferase [Xanthobacteraceae bacterium Astr-EGSB]
MGDLTASTPKPMLPVAGRPFIEHIIQDVARFGIGHICLLAGKFGGQIYEAYHGRTMYGSRLDVVVEPTLMGTAGALRHAVDRLDSVFFLLNGDSWVEADLVSLVRRWQEAKLVDPQIAVQLLLQRVQDVGRYGSVIVDGGKVVAFREKSPGGAGAPGFINAGVYIMCRQILDLIPDGRPISLESDALPLLIGRGSVSAVTAAGDYFVDIGLPASYDSAQKELLRRRTKPALILDWNATLNVDGRFANSHEDLVWQPEAREAIRYANDARYYVFLVADQSGTVQGCSGEADIWSFHTAVQASLFEIGAHIDGMEWRSHPVDGSHEGDRTMRRRQKPFSGMIEDIAASWPVDLTRSVVISDTETGMAASAATGVAGVRYASGSLLELVRTHVR